MSRPVRFRESDVARAVKVAGKLGLRVAGWEIAPDGTIRVLTGDAVANDKRNPLDRLHAA